jgi:phosphoserine phosphatase RsbX
MIAADRHTSSILEVGWASAALCVTHEGHPSERRSQSAIAERPGAPGWGPESGDLHVVAPFDGGSLVAVIDGLGHGSEAAEASRAAAEVLTRSPGEPVLRLLELCHEALRRTRGAVMSLCSFRTRPPGDRPSENLERPGAPRWAPAVMTWAGVGNVEAELRGGPHRRGAREALSARGGVVGYRLPPLRASEQPVSPGDLLILVTDGVRSNYGAGLALERSPQELADSILARHSKGTDDALVVVARYLGESG